MQSHSKACETARSRRCRCSCGGELHGKEHSNEEVKERHDDLERVALGKLEGGHGPARSHDCRFLDGAFRGVVRRGRWFLLRKTPV